MSPMPRKPWEWDAVISTRRLNNWASICAQSVKSSATRIDACRSLRLAVVLFAFFVSFLSLLAGAVKLPSPPAYSFRMVQAWIPMKDGIRLSATLYMPEGKPGEKFPALLDYLPYRKDDA